MDAKTIREWQEKYIRWKHREWVEARSASRSKTSGGFVSEARSRQAGRPPGAILMRVGLKASSFQLAYFGEFLGAAGERKEHQFLEPEGRNGQVAARKKEMSTCHLVYSCKHYVLCLRAYLASA